MSTTRPSTSSNSASGVRTIETMKDLTSCLRDAASNLVVLEFMAPWSEPSKSMEQPYKNVASEKEFISSNVQFLAVNFDKFQDLGRNLKVESLPVFLMVKNSTVEDRIVALRSDKLRDKIKEMLKKMKDNPNQP